MKSKPKTAKRNPGRLQRLVRRLAWTKTKPTKCGYYWVKAPRHNPQILRFRIITKMGGCHFVQPESGALSTEGWEWFCGPIPKPSNIKAEPR